MKCSHCPCPGYCQGEGPTHKFLCVMAQRGDKSDLRDLQARCENVKEAMVAPSFATQVASFKQAMADFVASGFATVDDAEKKRRFEICQACEWFDDDRSKCLKCGCYIGFKSLIASQHCPIGKW